jgi:hypothetical protein
MLLADNGQIRNLLSKYDNVFSGVSELPAARHAWSIGLQQKGGQYQLNIGGWMLRS